MTTENFAYWLNGFIELDGAPPTPTQWQQIKDHLALVFRKETPGVSIEGIKLDGGVEPQVSFPTYCSAKVPSDLRSNLLCSNNTDPHGMFPIVNATSC